MEITKDIRYIGVNDHDIDLFEGQYVVENGMAYNSYVILDDEICVMDTVDARFTAEWLSNLQKALDGRKPSYLVVQHMEPDHSAGILAFCEAYGDAKVVASAKAFTMMQQFYGMDFADRRIVIKEGDTLALGRHTLSFVAAPMVHWPEVMVTYDSKDKVLFSADAFGKFGTTDADEAWNCEARRYYFNIVGKYGKQVQALLKKASALDIEIICPLHGPVLSETVSEVLSLYDTWSSYEPENKGVFIACASIHGNTMQAAEKFKAMLEEKGCSRVVLADLTRDDIAECVEDGFRHSHLVLMASSYDAGVFAPMSDYLHHLQSKGFCNRTVALVENASWAPSAVRTMKAELEKMKDITLIDKTVTVKTRVNDAALAELNDLADEIMKTF